MVCRSLLCCLLAAGFLSGCGDDDGGIPAVDSGTTDGGARADAGGNGDGGTTDSGADDGGPVDGGTGSDAATDAATDGGSLVRQSRVTAIIPGAIVTLPVVDASSNPLVLDAAAAFDHDTTPGEDVFAAVGSDRYRLTGVGGGVATFDEATALTDSGSVPLSPDLWFGGRLSGATEDTFIGVFDSQARVYDFSTGFFGAPFDLIEGMAGPAFVPASGTFVDLTGTGGAVVATRDGSALPFVFDVTGGFFVAGPALVRCSDSGAIDPDILVGAALPGITPAGTTADAVIAIEGTDAYVLEELTPAICWSDAFALTDEAGAPLQPDVAFGWDFGGDGTDNLILVDTIEQ